MATPVNDSVNVGSSFETLPAAAYPDLAARTGRPATCIRRVQCFGATTISVMKGPTGLDSPPGLVPAGTVIDANISAITADVAILVFW